MGHQYILMFMCTATCFPEVIALRNLKARTIVKELSKFCSAFGLPLVIQTDQGKNFNSKLFEQELNGISVSHAVSSVYHPTVTGSSQAISLDTQIVDAEAGNDWADDLPFLLFVIRENVQESVGYNPAGFIFGHMVRGPLKLLRKQLVADNMPLVPVSKYVTYIRECLRNVCEIPKDELRCVAG